MNLEPTPVRPAEAQSALDDAFSEAPNEKPELPLFMGLLRQHQAHFIENHLTDYLDPDNDKHAEIQAASADRIILATDHGAHTTTLKELGFHPELLQDAVVNAHQNAVAEHYKMSDTDKQPIILNLPE